MMKKILCLSKSFKMVTGASFLIILFVNQSMGESPEIKPMTSFAESLLAVDSEKQINLIVQEAAQGDYSGAKSFLKGKQFVEIDIKALPYIAIENNLNLKVSKLNRLIAEKAEVAKNSAFDALFFFSFGYSRTDTSERGEDIYRRRFKGAEDDALDNFLNGLDEEEESSTTNVGAIYIDGEKVYSGEEDQYETSTERENASYTAHPPDVPDYWNGSMGLFKQFQWGQSINLSLSSIYRDRKYPSVGKWSMFYRYADPYPYGEVAWTSSLNFGVTSPVPYCKNFGKTGSSLYVDKKIAEINKIKGAWQEKTQTNTTLSTVCAAYWDLVSRIKKLHIAMEHRKRLEELAERTTRLFQEGYRTTYEKAQVDANLENVLNREEIAWTDMITASNRLAELLGYGADTVILPVEYTPTLTEAVTVDVENAPDRALENRPDLKAAHSDLESSNVLYQYRQNQKRPNLNLLFNMSLNQADSIYGYESWAESMGNLFDPDRSYFYVGIQYLWPVGRKAEKSALKQAAIRQRQNLRRVKIKENEITTELNQVISGLNSTENQKRQAKKNLELKEFSYNKALELREDYQQISDFEVLKKYGELLDAKNQYIDSLIRHQKSYVDFLSATGVIDRGF